MTENEKVITGLLNWSLSEHLRLYPQYDNQRLVYSYLDMIGTKLKNKPKSGAFFSLSQSEFNELVDFCVKFVKAEYNLDKGGICSTY